MPKLAALAFLAPLPPRHNLLKKEQRGPGMRIPPFGEGKQSLRPTLSDLAPPETGGFRAEARTHCESGGVA